MTTSGGSLPEPADVQTEVATKASLQHAAVRGASWTMIHTVVSLPIAFVANLLIARALGVEDYGRLAFLTIVMTMSMGILDVGLGAGVVQFGSRFHAAGRLDDVRHLLSRSQGLRLILVAPAVSVLVALVTDIDPWLLLVALAFGVWMPAALDGVLHCVAVESKSATGAKVAMVVNLVLQVSLVAVAFATYSADAVWVTRLMVGGLSILLYMPVVSRAYRRAVLRPRWPRAFPSGFWAFALPAGVAALIGLLALSRTEVLFLTWFSTPAAVGLFALAFGLAGHLFAPADALVGPLIPAVSGLHGIDRSTVATAFRRMVRTSSTVIGLMCGVALPALALLMPLFYGPQFAEAAPLFVALGVSGAILALGGPVSAFTSARLSSRQLLRANLVALAVNVVAMLALIPPLGVWGAVVANVSGATVRLGLLTHAEVTALALPWPVVLRDALPGVLSAPVAAAVWLSLARWDVPALLAAPVAGLVGLSLYLAALRLTRCGLAPRDRDAVARALPGGAGRPGRLVLAVLSARLDG